MEGTGDVKVYYRNECNGRNFRHSTVQTASRNTTSAKVKELVEAGSLRGNKVDLVWFERGAWQVKWKD